MKIRNKFRKYLAAAGCMVSICSLTAVVPASVYADEEQTNDYGEDSHDNEDFQDNIPEEVTETSDEGVSFGELSSGVSAVKDNEDTGQTEDESGSSDDNNKDGQSENTDVNKQESGQDETETEIRDGFVLENDSWAFYKNDVLYTSQDIVFGTIRGVEGWFYISDGVWQPGFTGIKNNANGWWYVKNGRVRFDFTGFASNENGWWYLEDSKVTFSKNDVIYGRVNGADGWWNVKGSKVLFNETIEQNANGWWYIKNGKVDFTKTGVEQNQNGWWYVKNGKVQFDYTGIRNNRNGWWYIRNGKVDFSYTGFASNENGWWYIENGKVTFIRNDVIYGRVNGEYAWWNVKGSKVIFNETIEQNANGWWYIKNGKVDFTKTSVEQNQNGWWYVKNGKVQFDYTGIRNNRNGWWYIKNGKVDFSYTGIASNENGTWYIVNGKVDFNANGTRTVGNITYTVSNGRITGTVNTVQSQMIAKAKNYTTSTGYMILVDRSACKVGIFTGSGSNATISKYWSCCVGAPYTPTITGVYKLGAKGLYFNTGTTGRCWYYSQIQGDYLFHSVIYDRSSSPVNIIDGTMGEHVSHGCVRLDVENAKYIYLNIPSGSTIVIYN